MNGLRVYINPENADQQNAGQAFYIRREGGPFYHWRYEEKLGQWRSSRVHLSVLTLRTLSVASWKAVPNELRVSLSEHYLE